MRSSAFASLLLLGGTTLVMACRVEASVVDGAPPSAPPAPVASRSVCEIDSWISCPAILTEGGPPQEGTVAWANLEDATLAVYADGTVQRTPRWRSLRVPAPEGFIIANVSNDVLAQIREDVASVGPDDIGRFGAAPNVLLQLPQGRTCASTQGLPTCQTVPLRHLRDDLTKLAMAVDAKWRAATAGTVQLLSRARFAGTWPLASELAVDGVLTLDREEAKLVETGSIYRVSADVFMRIDGTMGFDDVVYVYASRVTSVVLGDEMADLRAKLVANVGGDAIALGSDRFPAFKRREIAVLPAADGEPETYYGLSAVEHLDLRNDGPIEAIPKAADELH